MAKLMEVVIQANQPTGLYINKFNLFGESRNEGLIDSLPILETLGFQPSTPTTVRAGSILQGLLNLTQPAFEITQLYCRDVYNVLDFAQISLSGAGWQGTRTTGNSQACWDVAKLKSTRNRQDIGAGFKALPYMLDTDTVSAIGTLEASYITLMNALCTRLDDGIDVGGVGLAFFYGWTIVKKEQYTTPRGKKAYRYYADKAVQFDNLATGVRWTPVERLTTQNSRKFGKGR